MTDVPAIIAAELAHQHPMRVAPKVTAESTFEELRVDWIDRTCIAIALSEVTGREFRDAEIEQWTCVADVVESVETVCG